jgi:translation initiation factor 3 subunit K
MGGEGSPAHAEARKLLETDRYNVSILPQLTDCVHKQVEEGWYDLELNLALLKLYQFNPDPNAGHVQLDVMVKVLALALMRVPSADFKLCLYLIPEQYQQEVDSLVKLAEKLEACEFGAFWEMLKRKPEVLALVGGLEDSLRKSIFETVTLAYQELPVSQLCEFLNCSQENLLKKFSDTGLKVEGDKAIMPVSVENRPKTNTVEENAQLPQLAQVLANTMF